jgi:ATP-binding cassette subfamily B protein
VNQLQRFLDEGASALLQVGTTVVVVSAGFVALSPKVAMLACMPIPFVLLGSFTYQRRIGPRYKVVREAVADLSGLLSNNLQGVATIKSFTAEGYEVERVSVASRAYQDANQAAIRVSSAFSPLIRMVIVCGFTGTLVAGGWLVHTGVLAVGSYSVMVFLTQRLLWPLTRLAQTMDLYQRAMASTTRVLDLLDTQPTIVDGPTTLAEVRGDVRFEGVDFSYPDGRRVLADVDLHVPAGKEVAVVGLTGSGKTTLVKLLLRFYQHQGGVVALDGHPVEELTLASLRGAIGLVSQDVFLLHGTVLENIAYGDPAPDRERAVAAARTAEAAEFIDELPDGYDTLIGERGKKLSGGQRQRLALARAVYKDPPVLVLDEATSAVDNETEAAIQRSMARLRADRTVLVIAHRLSTVRDADEIVVLHQGAVAEQGTHEHLLGSGGIYASLWKVQTGEGTA